MKPEASFSLVLALLRGIGLFLIHERDGVEVVVEVLYGIFGDDLGCGGEATRDAQVCGGGPPLLGLLERDINKHVGERV
jgi:hypothetical protein